MNQTIKSAWEEFCTKTIHPEASEAQRNEMELSFYAGYYFFLSFLQGLRELDASEDELAESVAAIARECCEFFEARMQGGAANEQ